MAIEGKGGKGERNRDISAATFLHRDVRTSGKLN